MSVFIQMINWLLFAGLQWLVIYKLCFSGKGKPTISQAYQKCFSPKMDMLILMTLAFMISQLSFLWIFLRVWLGVLAGHIFWPNKEKFSC